MTVRRAKNQSLIPLTLALLLLGFAPEASADLTLFVGANQIPSNRTVRGVALGFSLVIIGFEFEYSNTAGDEGAEAPSLQLGMFNMHLQTPGEISGVQLYGTFGGGLYRERLVDHQETNLGGNIGGGAKVSIMGPLQLRLDYRVFALRDRQIHRRPQRLYAGLNLAF